VTFVDWWHHIIKAPVPEVRDRRFLIHGPGGMSVPSPIHAKTITGGTGPHCWAPHTGEWEKRTGRGDVVPGALL